MSTYVLIHGACSGGWCWEKVVPLLKQAGHTVEAPDLPGHGLIIRISELEYIREADGALHIAASSYRREGSRGISHSWITAGDCQCCR